MEERLHALEAVLIDLADSFAHECIQATSHDLTCCYCGANKVLPSSDDTCQHRPNCPIVRARVLLKSTLHK